MRRFMLIASCFLLYGLLALVALTQWIAWYYGYSSSLGTPLVTLYGVPLYVPWRCINWTLAWRQDEHAGVFRLMPLVFMFVSLPAVVVSSRLMRRKPAEKVFSRWATWNDVKSMDLAGHHTGVPLGSFKKKLLAHVGDQHIICIAPTGAGKTSSLVVPAIFNWPGHIIVNDPKSEAAVLTSGFRETMSHVYRFNPMRDATCRINPLDAVRIRTDHEIRDTHTIARAMIDPDGQLESLDHWQSSALSLFTGLILHGLYSGEATNLHDLDRRLLSNPEEELEDVLKRISKYRHTAEGTHPAVARSAMDIGSRADRELSGVLSTTRLIMQLYQDERIRRATSTSDVSMRELYTSKQPCTFYFETSVNDIEHCKMLVRLLWQQYFDAALDAIPPSSHLETLVVMDEFPTLGRFELIQKRLDLIRGYKLRLLAITPGLNRLAQEYGSKHSLLEACHVRIIYAQNDPESAKTLAAMAGQHMISTHSKSKMHEHWELFEGRSTTTEQERAANLLSTTELMQLPAEEQVVCMANHPPIRTKKHMYWKDRNMTRLAQMTPAPAVSVRHMKAS